MKGDGTLSDTFGCLFQARPTGPSSSTYLAGDTPGCWAYCPLRVGVTYYWQIWFYTASPNSVDQSLVTCTGPYNTTCHTKVMTLTVGLPVPDFALSAPSSVSVVQGGQVPFDVTLQGINGFSSSITVQVNGLPPGVTATYVPTTGVMHISLAVGAGVAPGSYPFAVTGTSGALSHSASLMLVVARMPPPTATTPPIISGQSHVGSTLHVTSGSWTGAGLSYAYQWNRCDAAGGNCTSITNATGESYSLGKDDLGHVLTATITATDPGGTASTTSNAIGPVSSAPATPPVVRTYATHGRRGQTLKLFFSVSDDSGKASVAVAVYRSKTAVLKHAFPLQAVGGRYFITWRPGMTGIFAFCALARDAAGNTSPPSCAAVRVTR